MEQKRGLNFASLPGKLSAVALLAGASAHFSAFAQIVPPAPTSLPAPLTLSQAIAIALRQQPQRYIAQAQTSQARGQNQQVNARYFPTLTPTYVYQNSSSVLYGIPSTTFTTPSTTGTSTGTGTTTGPTTGTGTPVTGTTITETPNEVTIVRGGGLSVALSQTLFDSGQRELANAEARHAVQAAEYGETDTRQQIVLTVTQDYYTLLQDIDLVKVAQAQIDRFQQTLNLTKAQVAAGTTAAVNIYQAQADVANAQVTLLQDQNSVNTASSALKNAMGVEADAVVQPALLAQGDQLPPLPTPGQQGTLDSYVQTAYKNRPDLLQQEALVQNDNAALKAAQISAGLSVSATAALTYQATNDVGARGLDTQLLLNGTYPLFDAGAAHGVVRSAQGARDAALDQLTLVRQAVREAVEEAFATRTVTFQAAQLAQVAVNASRVNYEAVAASRQAGIDTNLDVTTAQATLTQAQDQYVVAVYNFYTADAALSRATGLNSGPVGR